MQIKDVMNTNPYTLTEDNTILSASQYMAKEKIRNLPVTDSNKKLLGLITLREIIDAWSRDPRKTLIKETMLTKITTVEPSMPLKGAIEMMIINKFGCLPITENNNLVGFVTETDMLGKLYELVELKHDKTLVKEIMDSKLCSMIEENDISEVSELMKKEKIRNLAIVDKDKKLKGLITLREIVNALSLIYGTEKISIKTAMLIQIATIDSEALLQTAVETMLANKYGCLPVVEADNTLIGIISENILLKCLYSQIKVPEDFFTQRLGKYFM